MNKGSEQHADLAEVFNEDKARVGWHDETLWFVRQKRDKQAFSVPDWERLRETASAIKSHTLTQLNEYLQQFEEKAIANGIQVHWAKDAAEHNEIVYSLLQQHGIDRMIKSKSMLTEECHLNPYLQEHGIEVIDTDLGERIVQLAEEQPSHIVLPSIHKKERRDRSIVS